MSIPASHIVKVMPRVISGGSNDLEMNGLIITETQLIPADEQLLDFTSAETVGSYFGLDSEEYKAAIVYFNGFDNRSVSPRKLFIGRRIAEDAPAWLRGGVLDRSLHLSLSAITDGALKVTVDGSVVSLGGVSFSGCQSLSQAAAALEAAFASVGCPAKVSYSSVTRAMTITSPTSGNGSGMAFAGVSATGTDLAALFRLTESDGAVRSPGMAGMSRDEQMTAFRARSENWVSFTSLSEDAEEIMALAKWANDNYGWLYVAHSSDVTITQPGVVSDPASRLKDAGLDNTTIVYGSLAYAAFIMGSIASVDWLRRNGSVTFAFKRQKGLAATVSDEATAAVLESKNCNYMGDFATRNAEFVFLYPASLSASDYGFIDPYINAVWLNNRIQVALMDGLSRNGRVPYNERGYTMIRSWLMGPVNQAMNNAAIEPGIELSESQKSELFNEAGTDIAQELAIQGYYIQVLDPGAEQRAKRESPVISLWYTYGGAVQRVEVASAAVL